MWNCSRYNLIYVKKIKSNQKLLSNTCTGSVKFQIHNNLESTCICYMIKLLQLQAEEQSLRQQLQNLETEQEHTEALLEKEREISQKLQDEEDK